jgi:phosphoribosylformylglycinamidine cyclo-ligase
MAITYKQSGVNYSLMDAFKNACIKAGGNAPQLLEFPDFYLTDILEGLGSLNQLADDLYSKIDKDFYYQVGWGNAATILNDLAASGAKPLSLKLFAGAGSEDWFVDTKRWKNLIQGFKDAAQYSTVPWNGGETQTLVSVIYGKSIVLAGSATGIIQPKTNLLDENKIQSGDRIILLQSSGIHTNGITLIRSLFADDPQTATLAIKPKTIIYSPLIQKLLSKNVELHFGSHITGHGWRKIMRPKKRFSYIIEQVPTPQPIFKKIQDKTGMTDYEMYSDYNMGIGFALYVPEKSVKRVLEIAKDFKIKAFDAGYIKTGPRKVAIQPLKIVLKGKSLIIR